MPGCIGIAPISYTGDRSHQCDDAVRRDVLLDGQRHGGPADRDQGCRRRRRHLRWQWQLQLVQREGRELQLFRRRDDPEYGHRHLGGHAIHRRIEGAHRQTLPLRRRESRYLHQLLRLERLLYRGQLFFGRNDSKHLLGWNGPFWAQFNGVDGQIFPPVLASYTAVRLYGPGHVVAYNYIADFHDGIDVETYGNPDGSHAIDGPHYPPRECWDRRPVAIDFYNNYLTNFHDNAVEIDGSLHNVRVMRNLMVNSASHPFCNQPAIGGPIYWIRNIAYHAPGGSTRLTNGAAGVLFYNNTILTETSAGSSANVHWRNNLMLGENSAPAIFSVNTNTNYSSSDYNGFRPNAGAAFSFEWNSPRRDTLADYSGLIAGGGRGSQRRTRVSRRAGSQRSLTTAPGHIRISIALLLTTTCS